MIYQSEGSECGLACLAMLLNYFGKQTNLTTLRRTMAVSTKGATLEHLKGMADDVGLSTRALRVRLGDLKELQTPCILHWNMDHFVVLARAHRKGLTILDPAAGRREITMPDADRRFTGVALEASPAMSFRTGTDRHRLRLRDFIIGKAGLTTPWIQMLLLSIALQIFGLLSPFYLQVVIDDVAINNDVDLLLLLAISFAGLVCFSSLTAGLRSWVSIGLSSTLNYAWSGALFRHLIRLPYAYFEKRQLGDIQSRFKSIQAIQNLLAHQTMQILVDGMMAISTLFVMLAYSSALAVVVVISVLLHTIMRVSLMPAQRSASLDRLTKNARADTFFLESMRGIVAIRNFGRELQRENVYRDRVADDINASINEARVSVCIDVASQLNFGLQNVLVIWFGAHAVIGGNMSVGMLIAFMAYKLQFASRGRALIDQLSQLRLLRLHLERISDIADTATEGNRHCNGHHVRCLRGALQVNNVWFRYGKNEAYVLTGQTFSIEPGEQVAITGPSGCGKSTLFKLMIGLDQPQKGSIDVDGQALARMDITAYRRQIGTVMQDDRLFAGSLLDNVTFFDPKPDLKHAEQCCEIVGIAHEISRMHMGFHTRVGDMGDALSGGQRQRLLLARALYHKPRILFLDEATSHLDADLECLAVSSLAKLKMTRVVIAHRAESIRQADRVISLERSIRQGSLS